MPLPLISRRGSILFAVYAAIAMVGVVGVMAMNVLNGPIRAMTKVTHRTLAENHMMASGRLALMMSARETGDCDHDGRIEPIEWTAPGTKPAPSNGGLLPTTIGAVLQDPWGNAYGYCVWDHGAVRQHANCGAAARRLTGDDVMTKPVIAIISSGPDKIFQTSCHAEGQGEYVQRPAGSDDLILSYSFAEAIALSGGLWSLEPNDAQTATIGKNLSVTDSSGAKQLTFDATTKALSLGAGGTGALPNVKTDYIENLTAARPVEFLSNAKLKSALLSGDIEAAGKMSAGTASIATSTANTVAVTIASSGANGVGLKASGTSKAIEASGVIDMTEHKIVNLAVPAEDKDAATKKYVDDAVKVFSLKCDNFMPSACTGGGAQNLTKTNLGACKAACEAAGVQCCEATFPALTNNPNATLSTCKGYNAPSQPGGLAGLIGGLFGTIAAFCYNQY